MIELFDISVLVGKARLLSNVQLRMLAGELLCIAGPNGAGKSTLVRVAAGALPPSEGRVGFFGRPLSELKRSELSRRRAVVSQRSEVAFGFTSSEVVLLGRHPHSELPEGRRDLEIAQQMLERLEVGHLAGRDITTLSAGERQRVEIARALAQLQSDVPPAETALFLDEPTSNLDLLHQHAVLAQARDCSREGRLVVAVLHDLNLAAQYADRLVLLDSGKVAADGTPRAVLSSELIFQVFKTRTLVVPHPELDCPLVVSTR
ncbi:MAG TPA: heme ABC transporter ATP-binding protein [Polyangiaceae bacterium]|nr:heme ABC transporter ATP-binding protein [Polyangiaceae bacterium]